MAQLYTELQGLLGLESINLQRIYCFSPVTSRVPYYLLF